jgi:hypothetical protein
MALQFVVRDLGVASVFTALLVKIVEKYRRINSFERGVFGSFI